MLIIDSQIHCWENSALYPTPESAKALHGAEHTASQALSRMDAHGVHRSILVPKGGFKTGPTKNGYSLEAAAKYPDRFAVMGLFDLDDPNAAQALVNWKQSGMLGVRVYFRYSAEPIVNGSLDWFWAGLVENDLPFMSAAPGRMGAFKGVLQKFPQLRLIIDHAGRHPFDVEDEAAWTDLEDTLALARFPRTAIKVSSLPCYSSQPYPFPVLHEPIKRIYDAFGPQRMLWGSDVSRLRWSYEDNIRLFTEALPFLSHDDKEWIMGKATARACDWPIVTMPHTTKSIHIG